ncbi:MCE family protein [Stackebrandtia soli]|uniref:MCE family protein n=1 Tax=Stackebrandtia soli TaxID=1892856 RepID=UPI0039E983D5
MPSTTRLRLQIGIFGLVTLLGVSIVGVRYLGWFDSSYVIYVDTEETGGAYEHAAVAYRGVPVGKVGDVTLREDGARLQLLIRDDVRIPVDTAVVVAQRSAVGEQYVDLRPSTEDGPYLDEGAVLSDVTVPLPIEILLSNLDQLLESVDPEDVAVVIDELGAAFSGNEDALARLVEASSGLVTQANEHLPQTIDLLRDTNTVLSTQLESADAIRTWANELAELTDTIAESDEDLRALVNTAPTATEEITDLIDDVDPSLGVLLGNLITVNGVMVRRLPGLETVLVTYPMTVAGGFTVTPGDGTAHFGLVLNFDNPPPCVYSNSGVPYTCTDGELGDGSAIRGWQNAPGPTGPTVQPVPLPGAADDGDGDEPGVPDSGETAAYDPSTGFLVDSNGVPIRLGTNGGQYQLAGDQSWKHLLLTGVTG